ncbi:MAG: alpha-galactosidase [Phycisphaeraceae bacterium]|nr:alpha-galactosidase [Phycisphaeraceae bacterium]
MAKVAIIGGGSGKFVRELMVDFFTFEALRDLKITLMDINAERVDRSKRLVEKIIGELKIPATVEATTDQRRALAGADYVIITIMVGGFESYHADVAVPAKYGVYQAVSDTIGPGGVMRIIRTAPVLRQIAADLAELAPRAWVLNYANPMAMNIWTLLNAGQERCVGLCHSIQGFVYWHMQWWLGVPEKELTYTAAGINHVNFYLKLERNGEDMYPRLRAAREKIVREHPQEQVRFELLDHLGYFPAEGPWHQTEYYPWFHKDQKTVDHYAVGAFMGYNFDLQHFKDRTAELDAQITGTKPISYERSQEYGSRILNSLVTGEPGSFYGNVRNHGLIDNLPADAVVEVPCLVDRNGIFPCRMGRIPPQLAGVMTPHIAVHEMAVTATETKDLRLVQQAIAADPLAGAILTLPKLREMTEEMLANNKAYLKGWK